ncbi:MAG: hypothetical protein CUN56_07745 [Phototrophicales bacterium]|nr:MAG: hypothetical protein CUN56_07745 [Phototrophicales bacterium]RMG77427.1 MAG: hypothetical protein D6711_01670 [Chloroflexota bacterium]
MAEKTTKTEEAVEDAATTDENTPLNIFIDHQKKAAVAAAKALQGLIPTAVRENGKTAFKEMVEGYRQLFNAAIDDVVETIERMKPETKEEEEKK